MLKIGIAGLGTVGSGVCKILQQKKDLIKDRCGQEIVIQAISARNRKKDRGLKLGNVMWYDNAEHLASDPDVDVVVELIGGADGTAYNLVKNSLSNKKHVVTANKALISKHLQELASISEKNSAQLNFEAAVAGGIPIIKLLREGLSANGIKRISGILNGTCNFILTSMANDKKDFAVALKEAQNLGYAEADPAFDIEGIDAAHKLSILSGIAYGVIPNLDNVWVQGITKITIQDIEYASELGYVIKLLGISEFDEKEQTIFQMVCPFLVPKDVILASVSGVTNGALIDSDAAGKIFIDGAGAGSMATASAVVADLIDLASKRFTQPLNTSIKKAKKIKPKKLSDKVSCYYFRINVKDKPGVVASLTNVLKDKEISIESLLQKASKKDGKAQIIITTHETNEESISKTIKAISKIENVLEEPVMIRIFQN